MIITKKVRVEHVPLDECVGFNEPRVSYNFFSSIRRQEILGMFDSEPTKQMVVEKLMDGYNFHQIAKETKMKNNQIYKIKRELEQDLIFYL